jgi:hypothetical protein
LRPRRDLDGSVGRLEAASDRRVAHPALRGKRLLRLHPYAWLPGDRGLLIGLVTEWGSEAAILRPDGTVRSLRYDVDDVSRDARWFVGTQGGAEAPFDITIVRIADGNGRVVVHGDVCCPDWNR